MFCSHFHQIKFIYSDVWKQRPGCKNEIEMKCKYWKQLHGTMGLLKVLQLLFAFVMAVVCHYLWCDSICLADWIKRMKQRKCEPKLHAWIMNAAHGVRYNRSSCAWKSNDVNGFYVLNKNDISHIISLFHFSLFFPGIFSLLSFLKTWKIKSKLNIGILFPCFHSSEAGSIEISIFRTYAYQQR